MGIMGSAMAFNLLKAGFAVTVWNRNGQRPVLKDLAAAGGYSRCDNRPVRGRC